MSFLTLFIGVVYVKKYFEDHSGISLFVENIIIHHTPEYQMAHSEELMQRIFSSKLCLAISHQQSLLTKWCVHRTCYRCLLHPWSKTFFTHEAFIYIRSLAQDLIHRGDTLSWKTRSHFLHQI